MRNFVDHEFYRRELRRANVALAIGVLIIVLVFIVVHFDTLFG